ncbi:MAG: double-stranded DNA-binding protein, partial [Nitrosopumilus sp.]|nr:double-stranded DNA-binding protein [Nitrosopumilus sp.]
MSEEDSELERLKAKRLAEMQKNISTREEIKESTKSQKEKIPENPRASVVKILGFRGLEVLENAESQFPNETKIII